MMMLTHTPGAVWRLFFLTALLPLAHSQAITSLSLSFNFPHSCVNHCLDPNYPLGNMGSALGCASPVANDCYCATNSKAASIATSWIATCAAGNCGSGDIPDDSSAMKSVYASYCQGAGFTQPGMTDWYNPATATSSSPAQSSTSSSSAASSASPASSPTDGNSVSTTTSVTVVTHTTTSQPNAGSTNSVSLVVVPVTSTVNVNPAGSTWATASRPPNTSNVALGAGLGAGLGIPLLLAIAFCFWFIRRRNRKHAELTSTNRAQNAGGPHDFSGRHEMAQNSRSPPPQAQSPFEGLKVPKPTMNPAPRGPSQQPVISPISQPTSPLRGPELPGQDAHTEMPGFSVTPELGTGAGAGPRAATTSPGPPPYTQGQQGSPHELSPQQTVGRWMWQDHRGGQGGQGAGAGEGRWELSGSN